MFEMKMAMFEFKHHASLSQRFVVVLFFACGFLGVEMSSWVIPSHFEICLNYLIIIRLSTFNLLWKHAMSDEWHGFHAS